MQANNAVLGIILAVVAGTLLGSFTLLMKSMRGWQWENAWPAYCLWSLTVFCSIFALASVPGLLSVLLVAQPARALPLGLAVLRQCEAEILIRS